MEAQVNLALSDHIAVQSPPTYVLQFESQCISSAPGYLRSVLWIRQNRRSKIVTSPFYYRDTRPKKTATSVQLYCIDSPSLQVVAMNSIKLTKGQHLWVPLKFQVHTYISTVLALASWHVSV